MGSAVGVLEHDRLKLRLVEVDAKALGCLAIEARVAARPLSRYVNGSKDSSGLPHAPHVVSMTMLLKRLPAYGTVGSTIMAHVPATFKGTCALCPIGVDKRRSSAHHGTCAPAHDGATGRDADLVTLRVTALGAPEYWLDVEAEAGAILSKLDAFLRRIWLECCAHLSMFSVPPFRYSSSGGTLEMFGRANSERSMSAKIGTVFGRMARRGRTITTSDQLPA
jgi:hypothetical protein